MFMYEALSFEEAQQERYQLMQEGEYDAVVSTSEDKVSANSGNPMMDVTLNVFDDNGKSHDVRDFLVFTKTMMWKVVSFAESAGIMKEYADGKLCSELAIGRRVRVKIVIEEGSAIPDDKLNGKHTGAKYSDKNKVAEYIKIGEVDSKSGVSDVFTDDDIAF